MGEHKDLKILTGKNPLHSLVPGFLWEVGHVQAHGDRKYAPGNWKGGKANWLEYVGAILRHLVRYWSGEKYDPETGLHHMAHICCSVMYLWWFDEGDELPTRTCQCAVCQPQKGLYGANS